MAAFATEANVRLAAQIDDTALASTALIEASIAEAHEAVLADLDEAIDRENPPDALVQGETLMAVAVLLRALASRDAVEQMELQIGGQRIGGGQRFASLMTVARQFEKEAARALDAFAVTPAALPPGEPTATTEVLGV
jgi:hypothetical protein